MSVRFREMLRRRPLSTVQIAVYDQNGKLQAEFENVEIYPERSDVVRFLLFIKDDVSSWAGCTFVVTGQGINFLVTPRQYYELWGQAKQALGLGRKRCSAYAHA